MTKTMQDTRSYSKAGSNMIVEQNLSSGHSNKKLIYTVLTTIDFFFVYLQENFRFDLFLETWLLTTKIELLEVSVGYITNFGQSATRR